MRRIRQDGVGQFAGRTVIQYQYLATSRDFIYVLFMDVPEPRDRDLALSIKRIGESLRVY